MKKSEKGITLIALIITVVVLTALSVTAIRFTIGNNGIIDTAKRAKTDTALATKEEEVQLTINSLMLENNGDRRRITVSAVQEKIRANYASQEKKNAIVGTAIRDDEESEEETFPGIITYGRAVSGVSGDIIVTVDENLKIVNVEIGTKILIATSAYKSTNGVYCSSPDIVKFNKKKTYYVTYDGSGNETIEGRIDKIEEPENWYDYVNKKWANVVTIDSDKTTYWTYIPRYEYAIYNENTVHIVYIPETQEEADEGFVIPEAFTFNEVPLSGYWVSKYEIQE